jgi:histidine ammonia-lyase
MPVLSRAVVEIADVVAVARERAGVSLARVVELDVSAAREVVEEVLASATPVYGLTTELGAGRNIGVGAESLEDFQRRVIRNSSGGIGEPLSAEQTRAVIFARLVGFTRGGAGVTVELAGAYRDLITHGVQPLIPRTGSVGAADLTSLAAVAAVVTGQGRAIVDGAIVTGAEALAAARLFPLTLRPHEAIAALSGNAYSIGVGALAITDLRALLVGADAAVALSLEALAARGAGGSASPCDPRIQAAHRSPGQAASAARVRELRSCGAGSAGVPGSAESSLLSSLSPSAPSSVQDPVSFRAAPQVHGAARDATEQTAALLTLELNSRSENPLVDVESRSMVSGGNFQIVGLALGFESLRLALGHVAATSERRLARLSALGADLRRSGSARVPGLLWYSASALLAEIRQLANPVSLLGTSLSEDVEDHSSHAALALQQLERSIALTRTVMAIEAISAAELVLLGDGAGADLGAELAALVAVVSRGIDEGLPAEELAAAAERVLFA